MTTDTFDPTVPQMHAEAGFELDSAPPLRVSGFICLLFGALSFLSVLGQPMLVFSLLAIMFGVFALRRSGEQTPVGTRPAMLGIVLAVGFGACGFFIPWMKTMTLGGQAAKFSKDYMEVVARGEDEFALAGALRGEPLEMVKCKTVDLEAPAHAEIIIEGIIERSIPVR